MTEFKIITSTDMANLVQLGEAVPLLPEGVPGPVRYDGQWWAVPADATDYQPITDPDQTAMLDRNARRYATARGAAAGARERGGPS
jgi:hypothetical protein